jgi:hypothetical protein
MQSCHNGPPALASPSPDFRPGPGRTVSGGPRRLTKPPHMHRRGASLRCACTAHIFRHFCSVLRCASKLNIQAHQNKLCRHFLQKQYTTQSCQSWWHSFVITTLELRLEEDSNRIPYSPLMTFSPLSRRARIQYAIAWRQTKWYIILYISNCRECASVHRKPWSLWCTRTPHIFRTISASCDVLHFTIFPRFCAMCDVHGDLIPA